MTIMIGPLTALAIGDAYGAGFEFLPKLAMTPASNDACRYFQHTMEPRSPAGCYSDDTQRAIAVTRVLLEEFGRFDGDTSSDEAQRMFGEALVDTYMRDPRGGSPRMLAYYREAYASGRPLHEVVTDKRATSGGAMCATVFGGMGSIRNVMLLAQLQAGVTHNVEGCMAAEMAAYMACHLLRGQPRDTLRNNLKYLVSDKYPNIHPMFSQPWDKRVGPEDNGIPCVLAALTAIEQATSLRDLLIRCVALSGDTDTICAIALGAAWPCRELPNDLPESLWYGLEYGPYGRSYLRVLELKLAEKYNFKLRVD